MYEVSPFETPWPVRHFDLLDSTNACAGKLAADGEFGPCWIHADQQSRGRGRLGRTWVSPRGNLYATALFRFQGPAKDAPLVCFLAGLALTDLIGELQPALRTRVKLKWPNDLQVDGRKLAGILVELGSTKGTPWMLVGMGVNLAVAPDSVDRPTIALREFSADPNLAPSSFLQGLDRAFRNRMKQFASHGFGSARKDWMERNAHIGRKLSYTLNGQETEGEFIELAEDGALVVRGRDGEPHHVRAGDVGLIG